jgi:hypothetical protein
LALEAPYDQIVKEVVAGKDQADIIGHVGFQPVQTALLAADSVKDTDTSSYIKLLETVATRVQVGASLDKSVRRLLKGEEIDISRAGAELSKLEINRFNWRSGDQIEPRKAKWIPTYWEGWDEYFGGMPASGMILVGAPPKTGKTTTVVKLIDKMTRKKKKVGLLSLEMKAEEIMARWFEIRPNLPDGQRKLLRMDDGIYDVDSASVAISRLIASDPEIYCVFIDFADLMTPKGGREDTANASYIYMTIANTAKLIDRPIVLLCQLSDKYIGGIPRVNHIRYSRLAEAMAYMIVLIYNPDGIFVDMGKDNKANKLPYIEGSSYLIMGASRGGYKSGIGAIRFGFTGERGWEDEGLSWHNL